MERCNGVANILEFALFVQSINKRITVAFKFVCTLEQIKWVYSFTGSACVQNVLKVNTIKNSYLKKKDTTF